ncbi:Aox4, partial [Symbiodinium pilosum]
MNGYEVTTIEEVGSPDKPHAIQTAMAKHSASQCGMCTPGMVMALYGHLAKGGSRAPQEIEGCIQGNLCRCTGYRPIHDAMKDAVLQPDCTADLAATKDYAPKSSVLSRDGQLWFNCTAIGDVFAALTYAAALPHRLVVGNTSTGVTKYYPYHRNDLPNVFINIQNVPELRAIEWNDKMLTLGAACTLSSVIEELEKATATAPQLAAIVRHLKLVAHPQVRDMGSWAGNVMIAKTHPDFPSDVCLLLTTLGAELKLMDADQKIQSVDIVTFLTDANLPRVGAKPQIIHSVTIPFPGANTFVDTFKIMRRHMNTHAELNAGFFFQFAADGPLSISDVRMVFGNVEHKPFVADATMKALRGQALTSALIESAGKVLKAEIEANIKDPSIPDPPFVVVDKQYRINLACNLFAKAALRGRQARGGVLTPEEISAAAAPQRPESSGDQKFTVDPLTEPVGQPVEKFQCVDQACGTAQYVADEPIRPRTLFGVPVHAEKVAAIKCIDVVECMEVVGVTHFISAADVKDLGAELIEGLLHLQGGSGPLVGWFRGRMLPQ